MDMINSHTKSSTIKKLWVHYCYKKKMFMNTLVAPRTISPKLNCSVRTIMYMLLCDFEMHC